MPQKTPDRYKMVPNPAAILQAKKRRPKLMAVVDEDNCTGCQVCVPFCPVDCIEPVPPGKYANTPIPPVHVRWDECIGCSLCARACTDLTWDAIRMLPIADFEKEFGVQVSETGPKGAAVRAG